MLNEAIVMKNYLSCLIVVLLLLFTEILIAQEKLIEEDKKSYLQYFQPAEDSLDHAFTLWQYATRGVVKGYNADSLNAVVSMLRQRVLQRQVEYITQHPNRYASLYYFNLNLVNSPRSSPDSLAAMFLRFSKDLQATELGKSIELSIRKKKALALNNEMPLFTFKTHTGAFINLSSFQDQKFVLLCFWNSWCVPCIRNIPQLKTIYKEYNGKGLEVISVSIDKDEQKWFASIQKYAMPWLQTVDLSTYIKGNRVQTLYDIQYIPQYFLLDKKGRLIYHNLLYNDGDDYIVLQQVLHDLIN
jgi:peroxiredoxin